MCFFHTLLRMIEHDYNMDVNTAIAFCKDMKNVYPRLKVLQDPGFGYLTLGEETPNLSGGEEGGGRAACGTPDEIKNSIQSVTGQFL